MRHLFGGSPADFAMERVGYQLQLRPFAIGTVWDAPTDGSQLTDLNDLATNPITQVTANSDGSVSFYGPDGVTLLYVDFGYGRRYAITATDTGSILADFIASGGEPGGWAQLNGSGKLDSDQAPTDLVAETLSVTDSATVEDLDVQGDLDVAGTLTPENLQLSGMRIYNPTVYGALGNGTGNDSTAINAALSAASAAGGGWVIVPSGTYMIGAILRIYGNTRLTLMPGTEFRRNYAGTMILNGDAAQSLGGYTGHGNILIEGGVWNMRGTTAGLTASAMCMSIGHARGITIRDTEILDLPGYHAIELNSVQTGRILNCQFRGYIDPGSRDFSEAVQIDLAKSSSVFGGFGPYDNTVCQDIEVRGCYVGASGTAGTVAWPRGIGSHSATIGTRHSGIRITGNTFDGLSQYAVGGYDWRDTVIQGNVISGCGAGVRMRVVDTGDTEDTKNLAGTQTSASQDLRNITISGNTIRGTTGHDDAILLMGEATGKVLDATITGNVIDGVTSGSQNGIRLEYVEQYTVSGNTIRDTAGTGISQQNIVGSTVTGNRVYTPTASGISCDTGTGVLIASNTIRDAGVNGVHVLSGSDVQVTGNYIKGASRSAAGSWGIRCSTSSDGLLIAGNKVRKFGSGNEVAAGIGITSTCTNVRRYGNDLSDTGVDDQSTGPDTSPFDLGFGAVENAMRPSGRYETTSRLRAGTSNTPTSGTLYLVPIWLPKGQVISNLGFVSGGTAASAPTNYWFTLHNSAKVALARTADQLTAAWAANTAKTLAIAQTTAGAASTYTTTYTGLHYLGVMIKATTVPNLVSEGSVADVLASVATGFGGTDASQTTPPTVTAGAFTAGAFGTGSGILLYGYAT
ncbi:right-handed parallel beta-helix repeat-containing protein [Streptomyces sp. LBUM 1486]|uniref:right-handed parallel beta-helix repeat-containing protein n=3 Tax=Streptomyces scabiei TaxID=1930 RepID=UPI001B332A2A|nr:right-handed parallel beta-helix repeat-containing protein [Streptomyces sp. LBUM 1486]MBP5918677.1 right-handed parallel beta-helix repeat-containing protein [Streptomyces sp. LBUM 1486]